MKYYGIDITQHKEFCYSVSEDEYKNLQVAQEKRSAFLPAALLPEYRHENVILSSKLKNSRKGLGLVWPREAQIPVGGDNKNGIGRVPLLTCLSNIKAAGDNNEWKYIDSKISWTPHVNQNSLSFSNASLLAQLWENCKENVQSCFVIPEGFAESAQQTLLEEFPNDIHLVPRSIALAVKWCEDNAARYQNLTFRMSSTLSLGYLICVALGFGEWEVSLIEIQAFKQNNKVFLLPVYDSRIEQQGLNFCGLSLCRQLLDNQDDNIAEQVIWRNLCNSSWFDSILSGTTKLELKTIVNIKNALMSPNKLKPPYSELAIMEGLKKKSNTYHSLPREITLSIEAQIQQYGQNQQPNLGIVAGGSFAALDIISANSQNIKLARWLLQQYNHLLPFTNYGPEVFAETAAKIAYNIAHDIPSYKIKLVPLHLYKIGRNKRGDRVGEWEPLVNTGTINAGETYHQTQPITGLHIPEGKEHLEVTLRRPGKNNEDMYRSVTAKIPIKTEQRESVVIFADIKPGQGFAKVQINSQKKGVFSAMLDWRTMRTVQKPELKLEYIPDVAFIEPERMAWYNAESYMKLFVQYNEANPDLPNIYLKALRNTLNKWRMDKNSTNIFRHLGALNSDGLLEKCPNPTILKTFRRTLLKSWQLETDSKRRDDLLRLGGWLYLYIPPEMIQEAMTAITSNKAKAVHLHVAGLTFHSTKQLAAFYNAFCLQDAPIGEWFRSLRNLVRFRDNALSDDVLSQEQTDRILSFVINNLRYCSPTIKRTNYNNTIEALGYLLKRRRYDENFLIAGDETTIELREQLKAIIETHPTEKYKKIARATLAFLNKEATMANMTAILEATGDDDE